MISKVNQIRVYILKISLRMIKSDPCTIYVSIMQTFWRQTAKTRAVEGLFLIDSMNDIFIIIKMNIVLKNEWTRIDWITRKHWHTASDPYIVRITGPTCVTKNLNIKQQQIYNIPIAIACESGILFISHIQFITQCFIENKFKKNL